VCLVKPAPARADMISFDTDRAADLGGQERPSSTKSRYVAFAKLEVAGVEAGILL
jgi:hypothetical protein